MRVIILLVSLFAASQLSAQRIQVLKKAHNSYKEEAYDVALTEYEKLWKSGSGAKILGVDGKMNLADCYRRADRPYEAKDLYLDVLRYFKDKPDTYLHYGQVLMQLGQYNDAIVQFERHIELMPEDGRGAEYIKRIDAIREIQPLFEPVDITAEDNVNDSLTRQTGVTYYGNALVYASDEKEQRDVSSSPKGYFNMRIAGVNLEGKLKESEKFSVSLNGEKRHDGPASFSRDGRLIYYSQSVPTVDGKSTVLQIWLSSFKDGQWTEAKPLPIMFQDKNFTHPCLSADNKQLYFASDMKGSLGGLDLWVSNFEDGRWTYPKNLGEDINTTEDDGWPFIHPDGDLYFASKGHPGYGGYDIYQTRPLGNGVDWLDVQNLGKPFNSSFNDVSFIMSDDQTNGYISSNRNRTYDIFKYVIVGAERQEVSADLPKRLESPLTETKIDELEPVPVRGGDPIVNPDPTTGGDPIVNPDPTTGGNPIVNPDPTTGGDPTKTENDDPFKEPDNDGQVVLIVKLQLLDGFGNAIQGAQVNVSNKFTGDSKLYDVNNQGVAEIRLEPNQKYNLIGIKDGYAEASKSVSTMGATATQTVGSTLKMQKK